MYNILVSVFIVLPSLANGGIIYVQGCGTNNTGYSIGIATAGIGGIRIYTGNGYYSDLGAIISVNTTYRYTYYTANNNPWGTSFNSPSWQMETLSNNLIPYSPNINLHLLYTNNNQTSTGYCDLQLNSVQPGSQIRFKDVNSYLNKSPLQIVGSSSFTINSNTTETLNTSNLSNLYVWLGGSSGGNLMTL